MIWVVEYGIFSTPGYPSLILSNPIVHQPSELPINAWENELNYPIADNPTYWIIGPYFSDLRGTIQLFHRIIQPLYKNKKYLEKSRKKTWCKYQRKNYSLRAVIFSASFSIIKSSIQILNWCIQIWSVINSNKISGSPTLLVFLYQLLDNLIWVIRTSEHPNSFAVHLGDQIIQFLLYLCTHGSNKIDSCYDANRA